MLPEDVVYLTADMLPKAHASACEYFRRNILSSYHQNLTVRVCTEAAPLRNFHVFSCYKRAMLADAYNITALFLAALNSYRRCNIISNVNTLLSTSPPPSLPATDHKFPRKVT